MKVNQEQRAYSAWTILTSYAAKSETITYGELGRQLNIHHRAVRFVLELMQDFCMQNQLPPLTILVLNKNTGLPGDGFIAYDIENSQDGIEKVFSYNWTTIQNPFEYAEIGSTENHLIDDIISNPTNSADTYAKVKVRGIAQRIFRQALLKVYNCQCSICGLTFEEALEASHIIPYSLSKPDQRLDVRNGLLLCSTHHKLFDNGYLTINQDYTINYSDNEKRKEKNGTYNNLMTADLSGKSLILPTDDKHKPNKEYLFNHQKND